MEENKVTETIGCVGISLMIIIFVVLGLNYYCGDFLNILK